MAKADVVELDGAHALGGVACPCGMKFLRPLLTGETDAEARMRRAVASHLVESHSISSVKAPFLAALIVDGKDLPEHDLAALRPNQKAVEEVEPAAPASPGRDVDVATKPHRANPSACKHCAALPAGEKCARHDGPSHSTAFVKTGQRKGPPSRRPDLEPGEDLEVDVAVDQAKRALERVIADLSIRLEKARKARAALEEVR